jgi:hypothetical protein
MNQIDKIDYMIKSLEVAKDEIEYAQNWEVDKHRYPNGTIIRESLRMVGRMANQVANDVSLSPYCSELFKED